MTRLLLPLACLVLAFLACSGVQQAAPPPPVVPVTYRLGVDGRVLQVLSPTKVRINRGQDDGLTLGADRLGLYPMRTPPGGKSRSLNLHVRLARGKVVELRPRDATVELSAIAQPVQVGDFVTYVLQVPDDPEQDLLLELAALDIELRPLTPEQPFYRFADVRSDKTQQKRDAIVQALLAEVHLQAELAKEVLKHRIEGGKFHGQMLSAAFQASTREDIVEFLRFVRAFPGKYVASTWKFVEVYATWMINRTPTGDRFFAERKAEPLNKKARQACAAGRFDEAEEAWRQALALLPDDKELPKKLESLQKIRIDQATLERDPDDTATRWRLMTALFDRSALDLVEAELKRLEKQGYRPDDVRRYRGMVATRREKFADAVALFKPLVQEGKSKAAATWLRYAEERQKLAADPKSAQAKLALARMHEEEKNWDDAAGAYHEAMDLAVTPEEFAEARAGQERSAALEAADDALKSCQNSVTDHDTRSLFETKLPQMLEACAQLPERKACQAERLGKLADTAWSVWEKSLAITLRRQQLDRAPEDADARNEMAWKLYHTRDDEGAGQLARRALKSAPDKAAPWLLLGRIALRAGQLEAAEEAARKALERYATYSGAEILLGRIAALRGRWDDAVQHMDKAWKILPNDGESQGKRAAALQARDAAAALPQAKDPDRERLRLVRAWVALDLPDAATAEIARLKADSPHLPAAWEAMLGADQQEVPPTYLIRAAEARGGTAGWLVLRKELVLARQAYEATTRKPADRLRLARALVAEGLYGEALAVVGEPQPGSAEADVEELARTGLKANHLAELADEASRRSDVQTTEKLLRQALEALDKVAAPNRLNVVWTLAWSLSNQGRNQEALDLAQRYLPVSQKYGNELTLTAHHRLIGGLLAQAGTLEAQAKAMHLVRETCERRDEVYCLAQIELDLSWLALHEGRQSEGLERAKASMRYAERSGVGRQRLQAMGQVADALLTRNDLAACQDLSEKLLKESRQVLDPHNEQLALMLLGATAMRRGDVQAARRRFGEVYALGVRTGNLYARAQARLFEGRVALDAAHDPKAALPLCEQAAQLYATLNDPIAEARALIGAGTARGQLGDLAGARKALDRALNLARQGQRASYVVSTQIERAHVLLKVGKLDEALPAAEEAARLADAADMGERQWAAWHVLGKVREAQKDDAKALEALDKAATLLAEELGRQGADEAKAGWLSVGRTRDVLKDAIDVCIRAGKVERALELLEMSRDAQLRRIFDPARLKVQSEELKKALTDYQDAESRNSAQKKALQEELAKPEAQRNEARVEALGKQVASSDGELRQLLLRLKRDHRQIYSLLAINPESISQLRDTLPPKALVVEYFTAGDALYVFLVSREQEKPKAIKVPVDAATLEQAVLAWRQAVSASTQPKRGKRAEALDSSVQAAADPQAQLARSRQLYQWLLQPIEADMAAAETVLLVPFGALYYLPIHALARPGSGPPEYALERYRLGYLSSTTVFKLLLKARDPGPRTLLAFANPDGTLPGARAELERVQGSFPDARVLWEREATKDQFFSLAGKFRIVHFATHGVLAADALASHLKMAGEPLTVDEITGFEGLEGKTDLVVLSACETAVEKGHASGDEVISIASAFATAGAPALVASLWQVDDAATAELMAEFYRRLRTEPGKDTLEALRQAQLHVLRLQKDGQRPWQDPAYWAAFELIGDFR